MARAPTLLVLAAASLGCTSSEPLVRGETVVFVDTDLPVPDVATEVRIDVYASDGTWLVSRDFTALDRSQWPLSFGLAAGEREEQRIVRARVFPRHRIRDYAGARAPVEEKVAPVEIPSSLEGMCSALPELAIGGEATLRFGSTVFTEWRSDGTCIGSNGSPLVTRSGAAGARVEIAERGTYRFELLKTVPPAFEVILFLRRECSEPASELSCGTYVVEAARDVPGFEDSSSTLEVPDLEPGTYTLLAASTIPEQHGELLVRATRAGTVTSPPVTSPSRTEERPGTALPRLLLGDRDQTPLSEPRVELTSDAFAMVTVRPGTLEHVRVVATGACVARSAELVAADERRLDVASIRACRDGEMAPLEPAQVVAPGERTTRAGMFSTPRECEPTRPERVCVPGGMFVMGSELFDGTGVGASTPRRVVRLQTFYVDRDEVSVADYRALRAEGWVPKSGYVRANERPLGQDPFDPTSYCTLSAASLGREEHPLNCVAWPAARDFCRHRGGDLPTEAMWEYTAAVAGRSRPTIYPWGDDDPSCDRAVHDRTPSELSSGACRASGFEGPEPREASARDLTPLGIRGLGGSLGEWVRDSFAPYDAPCWRASTLDEPGCELSFSPMRSVRGGHWSESGNLTASALRDAAGTMMRQPTTGFRCVYSAP